MGLRLELRLRRAGTLLRLLWLRRGRLGQMAGIGHHLGRVIIARGGTTG